MFLIFDEERPSDSPYIERVWRSHTEAAGVFHSVAACHWEMVVTRYQGGTTLTIRGPETEATTAECPAGGEWFAIRFKLGTFMPLFRPGALRDRNDVNLEAASDRAFWLRGSAWEYPRLENAETFVDRLVREGLIARDPVIDAAMRREPQEVTARTMQRRFLQVTGLTHATVYQIERARRAAWMLQRGGSILDVMFQAGYYDQAHLTRSLRRWTGLTPGAIARGDARMSFLYKQDGI